MGHMGIGMQRWITNMKPRRFLGKRGKPDAGGGENLSGLNVQDYYHLDPHKLSNIVAKKYPEKYKRKLRNQLTKENYRQKIYLILSFIIALIVVAPLFYYFSALFNWF